MGAACRSVLRSGWFPGFDVWIRRLDSFDFTEVVMQYAFEVIHRLGVDMYVGFLLSSMIAIAVIRHFLNRS